MYFFISYGEGRMAFIMNGPRSVVDTETNACLKIIGTKEIEYMYATLTSPTINMNFGINIQKKFPEKPFIPGSPSNPCIMLRSADFNSEFYRLKMSNYEENSKIAEYIIRMIAFINKNYPISMAPFLWSDYNLLPRVRWIFKMPSDDYLMSISLPTESADENGK